MGGLGSGRPEIWPSLWSLYSVRTKQVRQACGFRPGMCGHVPFRDGVQVRVTTVEGAVLVNAVPVRIDYTRPHLGGWRAWFLCPNRGCGRRCTVVYGREQQWACQRCWRANYPSQKQGRYDRLIRKAKGLRRQLHDYREMVPADHVDFAGLVPDKPPRMHWRTYSRLACELRDVETEVARLFIEQTTRFLDRLKGKGAWLP